MPTQALSVKKPKVAVVILNWNGKHYLEQFLPSVLQSLYPNMELYVADNGSTDDSIEFLKSWSFELFVPTADNPLPPPPPKRARMGKYIIKLAENYGFAEGYNLALSQITHADYFVLLNSDVEVAPDWVDPVIEQMESDPQIAAAQPKVLMHAQKDLFEHAGAAGGFIDQWGYPFCRGRIFNSLESDQGQYNQSSEIFWASGAAMFVRAPLFSALGGLDADFFAHMEEIDFCWRLKRANYKIVYCPNAKVWHVGGGTLPKTNPRKDYLNFRNSLSTLLKNKEGAFNIWGSIFIRLILDAAAGILFLSKGNFGSIWAIIHAHWTFFLQIPKHWKKRKEIDKRLKAHSYMGKPTTNTSGIFKGSIVFQHYLRKVKKFSALPKKKLLK